MVSAPPLPSRERGKGEGVAPLVRPAGRAAVATRHHRHQQHRRHLAIFHEPQNCSGYPIVFCCFQTYIDGKTMKFSPQITKRTRRRKRKDGSVRLQDCYVLNFKDPRSGQRRQLFFDRRRDAEAKQRELYAEVADDSYVNARTAPTVGQALDAWLRDRETKVKPSTLKAYKVVGHLIRGPLLLGTRRERAVFTLGGKKPKGVGTLLMLGDIKVSDLTTAAIREWHRTLVAEVGAYSARRAKSFLKAVLALCEEDHRIRAPSMPTGLSRAKQRPRKAILAPVDIARLIKAAEADLDHGPYYGFAFLAGTRPSEQLGLLWSEVDFDAGVIRICRVQERDGTLTAMTKTEAGTREVPMGVTLRAMLLAWRVRCPRQDGELHRVFPGPGRLQPWPMPRVGGGPLLYQNFRRRFWEPAFKRLKLPYVTPHAARHSFISTMQAAGIEVGLVAKIAGHANPTVTLGHYTQAVRGGAAAVTALEQAYAAG